MKSLKYKILAFALMLTICDIYCQDQNCTNLKIKGEISDTRDVDPPITGTLPPPPPPPVPHEHERIVYWVHGFGGDYTALEKARAISTQPIPHVSSTQSNEVYINDLISYPARKIISHVPSYDTGLDLTTYGFDVGKQIRDFSVIENQTLGQSRNNICITSSWGGSVTRMGEVIWNGGSGFRAGGIASFGASHHGAIIANNLVEEGPQQEDLGFQLFDASAQTDLRVTQKFSNFLFKAQSDLRAGPKVYGFGTILLNLIKKVAPQVEKEINEIIKEIIELVPKVVGKGLFNKTALYLQTTNPQVALLQNNPNMTQNVAFYGAEDRDQTLWRLFYWGKNDPNLPSDQLESFTYNGQGYFEATDDQFGVKTFEKNLAAYQAKQEYHHKESQSSWWTGSLGALFKAKHKRAFLGYIKGVQWWQNSSRYWDILTGALTYVDGNVCTCYGEYEDPISGWSFPYSYVSQTCIPHDENEICAYNTIQNYKDNDGVVLKESAIDFPGFIDTIRMQGSNHFQIRNDENMRTQLLTLFAADPAGDLGFFYTPERD